MCATIRIVSEKKKRKNPTVEDAVNVELAEFARASANIERACEQGLISEHDRDERIARREDWAAGRIAFIRGEERPKPRKRKPLDDPDAGKVG
jgi:hypothetical protein